MGHSSGSSSFGHDGSGATWSSFGHALGRKECIFPQEEELRMAAPGRVRIFADSSWARDLHGVPLGMFWDREEGSF